MIISNQRYESFIANIRRQLIHNDGDISSEALTYIAHSTRSQIELLPRHIYWFFIFFLTGMIFLLTIVPSFIHSRVLRIFKKTPGFSSIVYYHEKLIAATDLEFSYGHKNFTSTHAKAEKKIEF